MSIKDELAKKRSQLTEKQASLLEKRRQGIATSRSATLSIPKRPEGDAIASFAQQRLWFLQQMELESATYNEFMTVRIKGQLNRLAFVKSLEEIQSRHEVTRTSLVLVAKEVQQRIDPVEQREIHLKEVDLRQVEEAEREERLQVLFKEEMNYTFQLAQGDVWRNTLFRVHDDVYVYLAVMHHAICDAWSMSIFSQELAAIYTACEQGLPSSLPELVIQYADFAHWQRQRLSGALQQTQLAYWSEQLGGVLPALALPLDKVRPAYQSNRGKRRYFAFPPSLSQDVKNFSLQEGVTLFMTLLAALNVVLYRYTGQKDLLVGTPVAGRTYPELESLIGFFTNTLVLRTDVDVRADFKTLVQHVRKTALDAYAHQDIPFDKVVEVVQPERSLSHSPLFQVMFILQNVPDTIRELPGITLISQEIDSQTAKFDLEIDIHETSQGLSGYIEYATDLFEDGTIERFITHFEQIIAAAMRAPGEQIGRLPLLTDEEHHQLLNVWGRNEVAYPTDVCYSELFDTQVKRTPQAIALIDGQVRLSYEELNHRASKLAAYLRSQGIGTDTLVALYCERGWQLVTAILAVFKAGGAYLPLDPAHPAERAIFTVKHSACRHVLVTSELQKQIEQLVTGEQLAQNIVSVGVIDNILQQDSDVLGSDVVVMDPHQLAYIIYTSGSTGQPKGVMIEQRGMINHIFAKIQDLDVCATDRVAQTASQCFDISVWQMLVPLVVGASVEIYPDEITHDPIRLIKEVANSKITIFETVPSLLHVAMDALERSTARPDLMMLRWFLMTGEALPPELTRRWFKLYPDVPMLNAYGPTECSDDVTHHALAVGVDETCSYTPIGQAVTNNRLYVLDASLQPLPVGVIGELYVGGVGVGRGYLTNPALTAESFIPDPFGEQEGGRLYKTGDTVRWNMDGILEYLGRSDEQLKVRGYRIEPGEIEAVLAQSPFVQQCAVLALEDAANQKVLAAYILPVVMDEETTKPVHFTRFLQERLPEYMVPSQFMFLENWPLNVNGKLDRRTLLALTPEVSYSINDMALPETSLEEVLAMIWSEVLERDPIDTRKSFFEMGGHSLLAAQVMARISDLFAVDIPLRWIFENPTIVGLAQAMLRDEQRKERIEQTAEMIMQVMMMSDDDVASTLEQGV